MGGLVQKIVKSSTPIIASGYSSFVRNLCSEMLNKNPNLRPTAENILARPEMQSVVRRLLEERRAEGGEKENEASRQNTPQCSPGRAGSNDRRSSGQNSRQNTPSPSPNRPSGNGSNRAPSRGRAISPSPSGSPQPAAR